MGKSNFRKMNNEKGFTLIEMLVSLSIFMILASISIFLLTPQKTSLNETQFITQLQADLLYGQTFAITNQQILQVKIYPNLRKYSISGNINSNFGLERNYDESIVFQKESSITFNINPNGNFSKFATYEFKIGKQKYKLTTLIGKGRFYVSEL
ncbi:MAG TPA: competence type IV pilus minor pilin ComGD [Niallia sp.]|nr:competence type IV pilus minor pilin ComGD [Niallia sp.]